MKRLFLVRHAKSDWGDPKLEDHERPLNGRGRHAATRIAKYLEEQGIEPSVVLCSSAVRALETLDRLRAGLPETTTIKVEPKLYGVGSRELLNRIRRMPDNAHSVMVIGHNPTMQEFALSLIKAGRSTRDLRAKFPTAAIAIVEAKIDEWKQLRPGEAKLVAFVTPKGLGH